MAWPARSDGREEARVVGVGRQETRDEFRPDLVVRLPDGGAERRHDAGALGAERLHGGDRRLDHAGEGAAPAGMRGADHARLGVGQQQRPAVGSGHADGEPRRAGDDGVGARAVLSVHGLSATTTSGE